MLSLTVQRCRCLVTITRRTIQQSPPRRRLTFGPTARQAFCLSSQASGTRYTITCPPTEHDLLYRHVSKHVLTLDQYLQRKPLLPHTQAAFQLAQQQIDFQSPLILDSGCGTGRSSLVLGQEFPDSVVLGVDRSLARLERNAACRQSIKNDDDTLVEQVADNVCLIRAELVDFWRCARQANITFSQHYLLYPNPYPKKARLQSRWYAHASFPLLLQMAPYTVIRSNWKQYLQEMAMAVQMANDMVSGSSSNTEETNAVPMPLILASGPRQRTANEPSWTNFEEKYQRAGEPTFELVLQYMPPSEQ